MNGAAVLFSEPANRVNSSRAHTVFGWDTVRASRTVVPPTPPARRGAGLTLTDGVPRSELHMDQYAEFIEIFKKDLEAEQQRLQLYQRGELRMMTLEADRWCDSTLIAIKETKQRITELEDRIIKYENVQAQPTR